MEFIIADASSLILSEKSGLLDAIVKEHRILIPEEVHREAVLKGKERGSPDAHTLGDKIEADLIQINKIKNSQLVKKMMSDFGMAMGETEAIVLFLEQKASFVMVDDHKAINACKAHKVPFMTTLALALMALKERNVTPKTAKDIIKCLAAHGRYKSEMILRAMQEVQNG